MSTVVPTQSPRSRLARLRPQWSLRTLLVAVALLSIPLGVFIWKARAINAEMDALERLELSGCIVFDEPIWCSWLWSKLLGRDAIQITHIWAEGDTQEQLLRALPYLPHLIDLSIEDIDPRLLPREALERLERLEVENDSIASLELQNLANLSKLTVRSESLSILCLRHLPKLTDLELDLPQMQGDSLPSPNDVPLLQSARIVSNAVINLDRWKSLQQLDSLALRNCILTEWNGLPHLTSLELSVCNFAESDIIAINQCAQLQELWLWGESPQLTIDISSIRPLRKLGIHNIALRGIDSLRNWGALTCLTLGSEDVCVNDLAALATLNNLRQLRIESNRLTDEGLACLAGCTGIDEVVLSGWKITDDGVRFLATMPDLTEVKLSGTSVTDAGVAFLINLPKLSALYLDSTDVTDECIPAIAAMPSLKHLAVRETQITEPGRQRLEAAGLYVDGEFWWP